MITLHGRGESTSFMYEGSIFGPAASDAYEAAMQDAAQWMAETFVSGIASVLDRVR
jgi:hypothetical protein